MDADDGDGEARQAGVAADPSSSSPCLACRKAPIEYRCRPCGCAALCAPCARKMATGGRCKRCKELFAELKRI